MEFKSGQKSKKFKLAHFFGFLISLVLILGAGFYIWRPKPQSKAVSPVPKAIAQSVSFAVYYPDPSKLPAGYILATGSFSRPVKNGVAYWVTYSGGQRIVFSVQAKPSDSELQTFEANYIPLSNTYSTSLGQAQIGIYHNQTLASLPINDGPWVVVTAPLNIDQAKLRQTLRALRHN